VGLGPREEQRQEGLGQEDAYRVMVGADAMRMDRLYRLSPSRAAAFIARQMKDLLPS
jgi:hypothetical protein